MFFIHIKLKTSVSNLPVRNSTQLKSIIAQIEVLVFQTGERAEQGLL